MKKSLKVTLCLALAVMLLVCAALAAEAPEVAKDEAVTGLSITSVNTGAITVTVPNTLAPLGEYVVMVVKPVSTVTGDTAAALLASAKAKAAAGTTPYEVSESTILYIDQNTASSGVTFTGIPKSGDGIIILTGGDAVQILGAVKTHGVTVTGTVTAKGATSGTATVTVGEESAQVTIGASGTGTYEITVPELGEMSVSMTNYVTRKYTLESETQNVEICLKGDVNGDGRVNAGDYVMVLSQAKNASANTLVDYARACGDVNDDTRINAGDYVMVLSQAKGLHTLW